MATAIRAMAPVHSSGSAGLCVGRIRERAAIDASSFSLPWLIRAALRGIHAFLTRWRHEIRCPLRTQDLPSSGERSTIAATPPQTAVHWHKTRNG